MSGNLILWLYNFALLALLAFLLLVEGVRFFWLLWWPIAVIAPLMLLERYLGSRFPGYLAVHIAGAALLYIARILLDLWLPIDIKR